MLIVLIALALSALSALMCGAWFRVRVAKPVEEMTEATRRIAGGSYGTEIPIQRKDELSELAVAINELSQEISKTEKMQSEFISSISHELRTPLTAITGWSETLMFDDAIQSDSRRGIQIISKEAARLTGMVEELLEFTRIQDGRFKLNIELLDIESELEDTIFTYQELLRQDNLELRYTPSETEIPLLPGDPERLKQVFLNILDNAAKYGRDGKTIEVSVYADAEAATIRFRDHGPGIPENELPHVTEKFYKGSETTIAAVITDSQTHHKYAMMDLHLMPRYAVLDPELTVGLPPRTTATTGMDALTHAIEAYVSWTYNTKESLRLAEEAVQLIFANLEKAYQNGSNLTLRENMMIAAFKAGFAFTRAGVGNVHAIAHTLGGLYNTPHGLANAVILPIVLEDYGAVVYPKLARLAEIAGVKTTGTEAEKARALIAEIYAMNERMGIPKGFDNIQEQDIPQIIEWALAEANPNYPVPVVYNAARCREVIDKIRAV